MKQIDMLEEIEVVEEPLAALWQKPAAEKFRSVLAGVMKGRKNVPPGSLRGVAP